MAHAVDNLLVALVVLIALCYAIYALGPAKLKTWALAQIGRYLGLRVLGLLTRKSSSGCAGCAAASTHPAAKSILRIKTPPTKPAR